MITPICFKNHEQLDRTIIDRLLKSNIFRQYKDLINLSKNIKTLEDFKEMAEKYEGNVSCTIDGVYYYDFEDDRFTVCRMESKNIAIYLNKDFKHNETNIHVFDDRGVRVYQGEITGFRYVKTKKGYAPQWKEIFSYLGLKEKQ